VEGVRSACACVLLILGAQLLHAQEKKPWAVDHLCGRVEYVRRTPENHNPNSFSEKRKPLRDVQLSLYERRENEDCCSGLSPLETSRTRKNGSFDFQAAKPGNYWVTTNWNGKQSKVAVVYEVQKDSFSKCSEQGIAVDDAGNADWWLTVTVD
jgi:hypothetical protein